MLGTRYTSEYQTTKIDVTYVVQENETKCIFKSFGVFFVLVFFTILSVCCFLRHTDLIQFRTVTMLMQTNKKKEINTEQLSGKYPSDCVLERKSGCPY